MEVLFQRELVIPRFYSLRNLHQHDRVSVDHVVRARLHASHLERILLDIAVERRAILVQSRHVFRRSTWHRPLCGPARKNNRINGLNLCHYYCICCSPLLVSQALESRILGRVPFLQSRI